MKAGPLHQPITVEQTDSEPDHIEYKSGSKLC